MTEDNSDFRNKEIFSKDFKTLVMESGYNFYSVV